MRPPIYAPKGKAKEYGDLALNIYTGCPHRCYYCFAPGVLHKDRETFHSHVEPRPGIVKEVRKQLEKEKKQAKRQQKQQDAPKTCDDGKRAEQSA